MKVRTRIAPSPTGDPHLGTAYIALFNWAFAKKHNGDFILRIEDTDQHRSSAESEKEILSALKWLGLDWKEGPDVNGDFGPYRQSERLEKYKKHADQLVEEGHAFHCFCDVETLEKMRSEQRSRGETARYDGRCERLAPSKLKERLSNNDPYVVRLKVPDQGPCLFTDALRGSIEIPWDQVDKQVLLKTDGFPTYHLAVVVDDHDMEITHVLRGEEWINSVPKHQLLYQYFGWPMPELCHLPLLRNPDHSKISKRKHPPSIGYYRKLGVLSEALVNYLATMGWSLSEDKEIFSLNEMLEKFSLEDIHLGGPVFDIDKLMWMNGQYLRGLSDDEFIDAMEQWAINRDNLKRLVPLFKERTERFSDIPSKVDYLIGDRKELVLEDFASLVIDDEQILLILDHISRGLQNLDHWDSDSIKLLCQNLSDYLDMKQRTLLAPLFIAIAGRSVALPLFDSMEFLGADITRARLRNSLQLFGVSKKKDKRLFKSYEGFIEAQKKT